MSDYFAISPSSDFFMHYGVKGMKWGVRKAIERGDSKSLARHYRKAAKKLNRLNRNADIDIQRLNVSKSIKRAAIGTGIAGAGIGGSIGLRNSANRLTKKIVPNPADNPIKPITIKENIIRENIIPETKIRENFITWDNVPIKTWNGPANVESAVSSSVQGAKRIGDNAVKASRYRQAGKAAKIVGLGALGYAGYNAGKAIASSYRKSKKGHAKAVAKRNDWRNHMLDTFKNTEYADLPAVPKKRRK